MIVRWQLIFGLILAVCKADNDVSSLRCPMLTECPGRSETCRSNEDCQGGDEEGGAICCPSPCGRVCTKQLFTGCEIVRMATLRRAKALTVKTRTPRCSKTGRFEPVQCDDETSTCWCVDETGFERPGTRNKPHLVNCTAPPAACADHTCRMFCPFGFATDPDGCPMCRCRDPCDDVPCPGALQCHLEEVPCADPPCPPVPTCKKGRSLSNICPVGEPLRVSTDTMRPFLCGAEPTKPQCPPLYQCLVQAGNDYGVCCPASLKIHKTGTCPKTLPEGQQCGMMCGHDLECPSIQKCCETELCGHSCLHPENITECFHQRALSELLSVSERSGRGYVPQCTEDGRFETKQCSRNGLVCWCVDRQGRKLKGTMGAAENVNCSESDARHEQTGRSIISSESSCSSSAECAQVCEYGFKTDPDTGCASCECDDPCVGFMCPEDEECVRVKEADCEEGSLCPSLPVCRPKAVYANPCAYGTPLTDALRGAPVACGGGGISCPQTHSCTSVAGSTQAVCCPIEDSYETPDEERQPTKDVDQDEIPDEERQQTMCEYLSSFSMNMEGTRAGMTLALPTPQCDRNGEFTPQQCDQVSDDNDARECWCVDRFGTEIPATRVDGGTEATLNCTSLRSNLTCPDLSCRLDCGEYGFVLDEETGCATCQCRDPCQSVTCQRLEQCQMVEVSCGDRFCPPVPACLPKKMGQCPYLIPSSSSSCDFECSSDLACNGTMRCCSNGCGTRCVEPLLLTACQHSKLLQEHDARESGVATHRSRIPGCLEDGSYAPKQCDQSHCWCVDENGWEISKTRRGKDEELRCEGVTEEEEAAGGGCEKLECERECEHGVQMDENGCRTCECLDPCDSISCRGDGERCRHVSVECVSGHCPSVPVCLPQRDNPCHKGEPLTQHEGNEVICGPDHETCPSTHKCQLSPVGEYAVCCPKPRDVCFEPLDKGTKCDDDNERNFTRFFFNSIKNKCEPFVYGGCKGNHNNFVTESACGEICPVLSQCERLREKNTRLKKPTFLPRCDPDTGNWLPVQCLDNVGVCWCVTPKGETLKGTLTRGGEPECNFRKARGRSGMDRKIVEVQDIVLEELMSQIHHNVDDLATEATSDVDETIAKEKSQYFSENVLALEQREIVSQSPVSMVAPYHTALIVIAAAAAFVICALALVVVMLRRKIQNLSTEKQIDNNRFVASNDNRPIYIELPPPSDKVQ